MKKLIRKSMNFILVVIMVLSMSAVAYADNVPDASKTGSISLTLFDHVTGEAIPGGEIEVIKVADIDYAAVKYVYVPALSACSADLSDLSDSELCNKLASFIAENGITGTKYAIGEDGKVKAFDLSLGAYIVKQTVAGEGYFPFNTFLITVPVLDKGEWVYDVSGNPKMDPTKAMTPTSTPTPTPTATPTVTPAGGPSITPANSSDTDEISPTPTPPEKLPQTGQLKWPIPVFALAGLVTFMLGWFIYKSDNEEESE